MSRPGAPITQASSSSWSSCSEYARPGDLVLGPDHRVGHPLVVGGHLVPLVRIGAAERAPARSSVWPSKARKSRSVRGRSGRAAAATAPPDRAPCGPLQRGAPASMNATMSPSNPRSTTASSRSAPTRGLRRRCRRSRASVVASSRARTATLHVAAAAAEIAAERLARSLVGSGAALGSSRCRAVRIMPGVQ